MRAQLTPPPERLPEGESRGLACDARMNMCALIIRESPMGIAILNGPDYQFAFTNPGFAPFACNREEIVGHTFAEIFPEAAVQALPLFEQVHRTGETHRVVDVPLPVRCDDVLQTMYFSATFTLLPAHQADHADILMIVQDTTHRVLAEQEKQRLIDEAEEHAAELDAILSSIADPLIIYAPDNTILRTNAAAERILRDIPHESLRMIWEHAHVTTAEGVEIPLTEFPASHALRGEQVSSKIVAVHLPHRDTLWLSVSSGPIRTPDGRLLGGVSTYTDITPLQNLRAERERLLVTLEERVAELDATITSIPDGVIIYSPLGEVVRANPSATRLLGFPEAERYDPLELRWENMRAQTADGTPIPLHRIPTRLALDGEEVHNIDIIVQRLHLGQRWFSVSAAPIRMRDGRVLGAVSTFTDVTERRAMEAALRESEEKFRMLAENAAAIIAIVQGRNFVYANPYLSHLSGYSQEELLALDIGALVHPSFRQLVLERAQLRQAGETELPTHYEFLMLTKEGGERWMDFSPARIEYHGQPAIVGVAYDVTEHKEAEEALRKSEKRFHSLFEHMNEGVSIDEMLFDESGHPVDWLIEDINPAYEEIYQVRREEVVGKLATTIYPFAVDQRSSFERYRQMIDSGAPLLLELDDARTQRHLLVAAFAMGNHRFATASTDITFLRKLQQEREQLLVEAQRRAAELDATLEAIPDALIIADCGGHIIRMNDIAARRMGYCTDDCLLSLEERMARVRLETLDGTPVPVEDTPMSRALRGEMVIGQLLVVHSNEETLWISTSAAPVLTPEGESLGAVLTASDITAMHQLQQERDIYVHTISHDLRAPLTAIQGFAAMLKEEIALQHLDGLLQQGMDAILRSTKRMHVMIADLVDTARLEGGELQLSKQPVQLAAYLADLLTRVETMLDITRIHLDIQADLPPVNADYDRLERIFMNLLTNALKYSPKESPVQIRACREGNAVLIAVQDYGQGIAAEDIPHLFERFYRTQRARDTEGIGLGLYITHMLVTAHGGELRVESEPGKGSTFYFTLPIR